MFIHALVHPLRTSSSKPNVERRALTGLAQLLGVAWSCSGPAGTHVPLLFRQALPCGQHGTGYLFPWGQ
jgi:hypothetical protein